MTYYLLNNKLFVLDVSSWFEIQGTIGYNELLL